MRNLSYFIIDIIINFSINIFATVIHYRRNVFLSLVCITRESQSIWYLIRFLIYSCLGYVRRRETCKYGRFLFLFLDKYQREGVEKMTRRLFIACWWKEGKLFVFTSVYGKTKGEWIKFLYFAFIVQIFDGIENFVNLVQFTSYFL